MAAHLDQLRETDFNFVKRQLHKLYRRRRAAETQQEYRHADNHIHGYQDFLSDNGYPKFTEIDDLKS